MTQRRRARTIGGSRREPATLGPEAVVVRDLCEALERFGWIWWRSPDSRKEMAGITDLVAVHPRTGTVLFWECKSERGYLSKTKVVVSRNDRTGRVRVYTRRGQTEWRDALLIAARRAGGVIDYRVVKPSTLRAALEFLVAEHIRAA